MEYLGSCCITIRDLSIPWRLGLAYPDFVAYYCNAVYLYNYYGPTILVVQKPLLSNYIEFCIENK